MSPRSRLALWMAFAMTSLVALDASAVSSAQRRAKAPVSFVDPPKPPPAARPGANPGEPSDYATLPPSKLTPVLIKTNKGYVATVRNYAWTSDAELKAQSAVIRERNLLKGRITNLGAVTRYYEAHPSESAPKQAKALVQTSRAHASVARFELKTGDERRAALSYGQAAQELRKAGSVMPRAPTLEARAARFEAKAKAIDPRYGPPKK